MADLSRKLVKQIETLKRPFMAFQKDLRLVNETRADLAPRVMQAYGAFLQETGESFVNFVRLLDPTVPVDRTAYRGHASYQAAEYLRRLVNRRDIGTRRAKPVRSNLTAMARLLATLIPLVNKADELWQGVAREFHLTARQLGRLRQVTSEAKPLIEVKGSKPLPFRVVHVPTEQESEVAARKTA